MFQSSLPSFTVSVIISSELPSSMGSRTNSTVAVQFDGTRDVDHRISRGNPFLYHTSPPFGLNTVTRPSSPGCGGTGGVVVAVGSGGGGVTKPAVILNGMAFEMPNGVMTLMGHASPMPQARSPGNANAIVAPSDEGRCSMTMWPRMKIL